LSIMANRDPQRQKNKLLVKGTKSEFIALRRRREGLISKTSPSSTSMCEHERADGVH
jgi:hypothetical protein